jgi:16S rRNA (guanine527-N7)-methyltransferase
VDETAPQLAAYVELLVKWNRAYNLTAERDPGRIAVRHVRDSLAVLPYLHGQTVLDVGTGAGLPGLVLAIADPPRHYTLLDSNGKKTRFCEHAVGALGVANATVVQARVEGYRPGASFDNVVSRAFATIADFIAAAGHLCAPGGRMLAMKGAYPEAELAALPGGWRTHAVHALDVPGLDARRHLALLTRD